MFTCIATLALAVTQPHPAARYEFTRVVMGVGAHLVIYAKSEPEAHDAANAAYRRLNELDRIMSDYRADSELMQLCRADAGEPHEVSPELADVLAEARVIAEKTGGAFDPTVGPIVKLWRAARSSGEKPDPAAVAEARAHVGYQLLHVDRDAHTVTLDKPGMSLDLGGIAKGYAADQVISLLAARGITSALVDLGGDITVSDPPPGADHWSVVVDDGVSDPAHTSLHNAAVATSGDLEQHVVIDHVRYSHIIDPRTGEPLSNGAAATVTAPTGMLADALASAACVLADAEAIQAAFDDVHVTIHTHPFAAP